MIVMFEKGKMRDPVAFIESKVSFPARGQQKVEVGDIWEVEVVEKERFNLLRLVDLKMSTKHNMARLRNAIGRRIGQDITGDLPGRYWMGNFPGGLCAMTISVTPDSIMGLWYGSRFIKEWVTFFNEAEFSLKGGQVTFKGQARGRDVTCNLTIGQGMIHAMDHERPFA